jgi:hypothetical protein
MLTLMEKNAYHVIVKDGNDFIYSLPMSHMKKYYTKRGNKVSEEEYVTDDRWFC